ncbi:hypothetical protein [Halorussus amylolyticus]|uniref:hypothetical protein n=1 Tax=Halorussus amylolyticus TaxID=1126242 RepID=UPI00138F898B|nr:hypothetical protein [Halorussus amylolyticus]
MAADRMVAGEELSNGGYSVAGLRGRSLSRNATPSAIAIAATHTPTIIIAEASREASAPKTESCVATA